MPTHDLVIVRRGLDYGRQGFDRWSLTREVLKAIGTPPTQEASLDRTEPRPWRFFSPR